MMNLRSQLTISEFWSNFSTFKIVEIINISNKKGRRKRIPLEGHDSKALDTISVFWRCWFYHICILKQINKNAKIIVIQFY
jgi:hypothetical protein